MRQKGLSLTEILVALAIFSVISTTLFTFISRILTNQRNLQKQVDDSTDLLLAERFLELDLKNVNAAFLGMTLNDDYNRNFYDFYPDTPERFLNNKERLFTLEAGNNREFYLLVEEIKLGGPLVFDPSLAYQIGNRPSPNIAGSLTFVSLNQNNFVSRNRPLLWQNGQLVLLDSPSWIRRPDATGNINILSPPKSMTFIGMVQNNNINVVNSLSNLFQNIHPETGQVMTSVDQFLRQLPSTGGGSPFVRLRGVKLIKYAVQEDTSAKKFNLTRSFFKQGSFERPQVVSSEVKKVIFYRQSPTSTAISYRIFK